MRTLQKMKAFFLNTITGTRNQAILQPGLHDLCLTTSQRLYLGWPANRYLYDAEFGVIYMDGGIGVFTMRSTGVYPNSTNTIPLGFAANRWTQGFFSTEIGVHDGTTFTAGFYRLSNANHYCKMPKLTTAERDAMAAAWGNDQKGYTIYNSTTNVLETWNGAAWV